MDKMREEFEAWYSGFYGYGDAHKKDLWDTWKASRAALCVELPDESSVWRYQDVCESLDDAGVSYK